MMPSPAERDEAFAREGTRISTQSSPSYILYTLFGDQYFPERLRPIHEPTTQAASHILFDGNAMTLAGNVSF